MNGSNKEETKCKICDYGWRCNECLHPHYREEAIETLESDNWEPIEPEYEGDARSSWWWVCGECHTAIDTRDKYCRECGRKIKWGN